MKTAMRIFLCLLMTGLLFACGGGGGGGGSSVGFPGDIANSPNSPTGPIQSGGNQNSQRRDSDSSGPQTDAEEITRDDDTTPEIVIDDTTPEIVIDDTTPEMADDDTTPEIVIDDTTPEIVIDDTTPEMVDDDTTTEMADDDMTTEMVDDDTTTEMADDDTTTEMVDDDTTAEMVDDDTTTEIVDDDMTTEMADDDTTTEMADGDTKIRLNVRTTESRIAPLPVNGLVATRKLSKELPPQIPQFGADSAEESPANKPPPPEPLIVMLGGLAPSGSDFLENDELLARVGQQDDDILVSFGGDEYGVYLPSSFGGNVNAFHRPGAAEKFTLSFSMMITPQPDETSRPWVIADGDFETRAIIAWAPEITDPFTVDLQVVVEYSDGVVYAGQILAARPQARIVSQCIADAPTDCPKTDREAYAAIAAYNQWAETHNADKMRIMMFPGWHVPTRFCKEQNKDDPVLCHNLRGGDKSYRLALASEGGSLDGFTEDSINAYINGESGPAALAEFLRANEEVLSVIPFYSEFFPDFHAATPLISPANATLTISLCRHDDEICRQNPQMTKTLGEIYPFSEITTATDLSDSKHQIIAVGAVVLTTDELPEDNALPEKHATHPGDYGVCGIAKEWCITAVDEDILTPPILPVDFHLKSSLNSGVYLDRTQQTEGRAPFRARADPGNYLSRSSAPRVVAVAAEVTAESGLQEAQAIQKILFKTAFKCRDDATGENRIAESVTQDNSLSFICGAGASPLNSDLYGQGILNRDGAAADARSLFVADGSGQQAGQLSDAKFRASAAMGDGLSSQLAEVDLMLKAESGNIYYHRPLKEGLSSADDSHHSSARIDGFGRTRKSRAFSFVGGEWFVHHQDAFTFADNPDSAASGFSFASSHAGSGAFSFSYDDHLLPSVFDSGESVLPEAKRLPFMNFVRRGWRAEWESPAQRFRVLAAMGGREDSIGDSSAAVGMIEWDLPIGNSAKNTKNAKNAKNKKHSGGFSVQVQAGAMTESDRLLGAFGQGAFSLSDGRTAFAGLRAEWEKDKTAIFGAFYRGITQAKGGVLFADNVRADSESWTLGIRRHNLFSRDDSLEFSLHQPLRVVGGEAKLLLPPDRNGEAQNNSLSLSATGRELDAGISYRRSLSELSEIRLGLLLRRQPGHISSAATDRLAIFSFKAKW